MKLKQSLLIAVVVLVGLIPIRSYAFLTSYFPYSMLNEKADLVVIAAPTNRQELDVSAVLPGVRAANNMGKGKPIPAVEIETTFQTLVILKGDFEFKDEKFVLVHYRWKQKPRFSHSYLRLVDFNPTDKKVFLMFLKKREDGRMEAYQEHIPGWCIEELAHPYEP